jgi:DNA modification methylase
MYNDEVNRSSEKTQSELQPRLIESIGESARSLPLEPQFQTSKDIGVTFQDSKSMEVHRWYPYVEGFSAKYVEEKILENGVLENIYDPFGGSGTTQLAATKLGINSFYSEVNPFMSFIAEAKVKDASWMRHNLEISRKIALLFIESIVPEKLTLLGLKIDLSDYLRAFPERDFFEEKNIRDLLAARQMAIDIASDYPHIQRVLLLACASNLVTSSNMTRRADLRRRRSDEYLTRVVDVSESLYQSVIEIISDIHNLPENMGNITKISDDCRTVTEEYRGFFDISITSPPYLNGTNYFRNTKIELWFLGFIESEKELGRFRDISVSGGINNVNKGRSIKFKFDEVEKIAEKLDLCATDKRIPQLVRQYFSDMYDVMLSMRNVLKPQAKFIIDIGDSKFYGVHVPTDLLLKVLAERAGFSLEREEMIARRYSRDKSELKQVELVFRNPLFVV